MADARLDAKLTQEIERRLSPQLDAAKGIAILAIFIYHIDKHWFGWQGVHVFIVSSGFGLALSLLKQEGQTWGEWFRRRGFRILPAYWMAVFAGFLLLLASLGVEGTLREQFRQAATQFALDLTLLRNCSYLSLFGEPNASLWYIPLLAGLYTIFPLWFILLRRNRSAAGLVSIVLAACVIEIAYRAAAIYFLDGSPVGYGAGFFGEFGVPHEKPLDLLPLVFLFRESAPFGLFLSRIGEFVLGMAATFVLWDRPQTFRRFVFGGPGLAAAILCWIAGIVGVAAARWSWAVDDLLIAAGFTLLLIRLTAVLPPGLSRNLGTLGRSSYYFYLAHMPPLIAFSHIYGRVRGNPALVAITGILSFSAIVAGTLLLRNFDQTVAHRQRPVPLAVH